MLCGLDCDAIQYELSKQDRQIFLEGSKFDMLSTTGSAAAGSNGGRPAF